MDRTHMFFQHFWLQPLASGLPDICGMPAPPGPTAIAMASEAEGNAGNVKDMWAGMGWVNFGRVMSGYNYTELYIYNYTNYLYMYILNMVYGR